MDPIARVVLGWTLFFIALFSGTTGFVYFLFWRNENKKRKAKITIKR